MILVDWSIGALGHSFNVVFFLRTDLNLGKTHKVLEQHGGRKHDTPALFEERTLEKRCSVRVRVLLGGCNHRRDVAEFLDRDRIWYLHRVAPSSLEGSWIGWPRSGG